MTPDFIYVQPASPGVDEQPTSSNMSHYNSLPTSGSSSGRSHSYTGTSPSSSTSSRPGLRRSSASARQSAAAVFGDYAAQYGSSSTSPTSTAGDYGDVPPPRSSSSSSLSSQARRSRRQMSASADSSPRHSISYHTPLPRIQDDESAVAGSPPVTPVNSTFEHDHPENAGSVSNGRRSTTTAASSSSPKQTRAGLPRIKSVSMQPSFSDSALATSSSSATSSINNTSDDDSDNSSKATAKAVLSSPLLQKHKPSWGEIPGAASSTLLGGNLSTAFQFGQALPNTPNGDHYLQAGSGAGGSSSGSSTPTPKAEKAEDAAIAGAHSQINGAIPGNNDLQLVNGELGDRPDWTPASSSSTTQPSTNTSVGSSLASSGAGSSTNDNQNGAGAFSINGSSLARTFGLSYAYPCLTFHFQAPDRDRDQLPLALNHLNLHHHQHQPLLQVSLAPRPPAGLAVRLPQGHLPLLQSSYVDQHIPKLSLKEPNLLSDLNSKQIIIIIRVVHILLLTRV